MNPEFILDIQITFRQTDYSQGQLTVREEVHLKAAGFLQLCKILGQFHDLAETLKAESQG